MCSPRKFHSKHSKHPKHSRLYQGRDSAARQAPIKHVLWLSYPMINDPAQPEGAKEARDSEADTSSIDTILQNSLENTAQHTHYPSISEIEERICAEMKAIKAAKEAKEAKEPKEADEIKKAISL